MQEMLPPLSYSYSIMDNTFLLQVIKLAACSVTLRFKLGRCSYSTGQVRNNDIKSLKQVNGFWICDISM